MMGTVILYEDDLILGSSSISQYCRICHEAEFESCKSLEAPCACSGTVKFAHRDCIQRWCDEKGSTTCEICLQNYEPGYTAAAPKKKCQLIDGMTIRESVEIEITRREEDDEGEGEGEGEAQRQSQGFVVIAQLDSINNECTSSSDRTTSCCRTLVLSFTIVMLMRHLFTTLTGETEDYPFTLFTILVLRASGILIPMYLVFWTISAIQKSIQRQQYYQGYYDDNTSNSDEDDENDEQHRLQHLV